MLIPFVIWVRFVKPGRDDKTFGQLLNEPDFPEQKQAESIAELARSR
jgi:hypothetical protein